jgi:hypothetical protein
MQLAADRPPPECEHQGLTLLLTRELLLLNPFYLSAAEDDIKFSSCQRSAHSLLEQLGLPNAVGPIEDFDRLPAKD